MKVKPLLEKLTDKWPAKAICIVAACFFYIFNQYNSLDQKSVPVTLNVLQEGEMICTSRIPSSVSVTIRTSDENIGQVSAQGIEATLDLSYITHEGNFDVPVYVDLPQSLKSLDPLQVTVYPEKIKVHLEKNITRSVKVVARAAGEIPYGYTIKSFSIEPPYVEIFGPRSIVESINMIDTEAIIVDEKKATFTEQKHLVNRDKLVKVNNVSDVSVTTEIDLAKGTKTFNNVPVELRNLGMDFETDDRFFVDFTIGGSQLDLDEYKLKNNVLYANLEEINEEGTYEIPVVVLFAPQFHLEHISTENITVNIRKRPPPIIDENLEASEGAE